MVAGVRESLSAVKLPKNPFPRVPIRLPSADAFLSSHQEGGATIMRGTFTPLVPEVEIDVDISGYSSGWGGAGFVLNVGVLPEGTPPTPWEGGTRPSRIALLDNDGRTGLPGVTEFQFFPLGMFSGSDVLESVIDHRTLTGLTVGRTYQWDLRCGGVSYFKEHSFPAGFAPRYLASIPGDETYLMVGGSGATRKVAMLALGWAPGHNYVDVDLTTQRHFTLNVSADILGLEMQRHTTPDSARYCAVLHSTSITIIDTWTPSVVGNYSIGHALQSIKSNRAGTYFYVGCQTGHIHRFNIGTLAFDQQINMPASDFITVGGTNTGDTHLWANSVLLGLTYRIELAGPTVGASLHSGQYVFMEAMSDGRVVCLEQAAADLIVLSTAGAVLVNIDISGGGATGGFISLAPGEQRAMWTRGNRVGWAWLDSGQPINNAQFGFSDTTFGQVNNSTHEGTSVALPTTNKVIHWPGGEAVINPDVNEATAFGSMHAEVGFRGAEATYG